MKNYVHETVLRDIIDLMHDAKDYVPTGLDRQKSMKSITSKAAAYTFVFPVGVSDNNVIENAQMISKAIERKATSMLRLIFAANQTHNSDSVDSFIKKTHTNLNINPDLSIEGILDTIDKYVVKESQMGVVSTQVANREIYAAFRESDCEIVPIINESSIADFTISNFNGRTSINEAPTTRRFDRNGKRVSTPTDLDTEFKYLRNAKLKQDLDAGQQYGTPEDVMRRNLKDQETASNINKNNQYNSSEEKSRRELMDRKTGSEIAKNRSEFLKHNLLDNDVKKANELIETQMIVMMQGPEKVVQFIIGIKAKMYTISSADITERLGSKNKDNNFLLKLIRTTTGELSFFKDFIFAIDKAKMDALASSNYKKSSPLWKILERRATNSKFRRNVGLENNAMAITTLVITQEEVEYMKKEFNMDVENPQVILPIMESYNLMSFVIVDNSQEIAKFIFDTGQDIYEALTFSSLEREATDSSTKRIVNLIAKAGGM